MTSISVVRIGAGATVADWISVPVTVHRGDPHFIRQLDLKERLRIARWGSPFFTFGDAVFFVARRGGEPVGRISAQINRPYRERHDPTSGHFGFFDCIDDADVARALFDAARAWLAERGSTSILGPFSLTINEESGLLVEGFDEPAAAFMNQARPFTGALVEAAGLEKAMDTLAYRMRALPEVPKLERLSQSAALDGDVTIRQVRRADFAREVRLLIDIFNDAWSGNWGFVPWSEPEIRAISRDLKPFFRDEYGYVAEIDGRAVGFVLGIPDLNEAIAPFDGALLPLNWWRLLTFLKGRKSRRGRIPLMGIRREFHGSIAAAAILARLFRELIRFAPSRDIDWLEFSWILETNRPVRMLAEMIAGPPAKRYRLYKGAIATR